MRTPRDSAGAGGGLRRTLDRLRHFTLHHNSLVSLVEIMIDCLFLEVLDRVDHLDLADNRRGHRVVA